MKAEDIRVWAEQATQNIDVHDSTQHLQVLTAQALFEIAAQLAELNSNIRMDAALKDLDPRFIE